MMTFVYAFLVAGAICALTQILADLKIPFPLVAILLMVLGGGLLTKLGIFDKINALTTAGAAVTAMGCGNGAYSAGATLATTGVILPLILTVALNVLLVAMGAACGETVYKKFKDIL